MSVQKDELERIANFSFGATGLSYEEAEVLAKSFEEQLREVSTWARGGVEMCPGVSIIEQNWAWGRRLLRSALSDGGYRRNLSLGPFRINWGRDNLHGDGPGLHRYFSFSTKRLSWRSG